MGRALDTEIRAALETRGDADSLAAWDYLLEVGGNFEEVYRLAREIVHLDSVNALDPSSRFRCGRPTLAKQHVAGASALAGRDWDKDHLEEPGYLAAVAAAVLGRKVTEHLKYLDALDAVIQRQGRLTVSTLNYDSVVESWAAGQAAGYLQDDDPARWNSGQPWHAPTSTALQLLKLHGSADWQWVSRAPLGHRAMELPVVTRSGSSGTATDPAIILGAGNKLRSGGPFLALLEAFARALEAADHLVIVGYSFSDVHVNARIADWFDRDPVHRFITVVSGSWPNNGSGTYRSKFAETLDHRLRLTSTGGVQVGGMLASPRSDGVRLRIVRASAHDGLVEALSCPEVLDAYEPRLVIRQTGAGRDADLLT